MKAQALAGGVILVIGFLMYQTGVGIALEGSPYTLRFLEAATSLLRINLKTDTAIIFLEYVGGIIAILGFLVCVSSLASREVVVLPQPGEKREGGLLEGGLLSSEPVLKCKFCGAYIDKDDIFCAKCKRALK